MNATRSSEHSTSSPGDRVGTLVSLNVGLPADVPWRDSIVHTGIFKSPVSGPRMARRLNIDGDGQGDREGHGGENRAVLVYQVESYEHWRAHFGRDDLTAGSFGENFTVDGLSDEEIHIGDRLAIGDALFEVTQPRVTCYRIGMRLGEPQMPALLVAHHRPGFYLRVIREGLVRAGDAVFRTALGRHRLSVVDIDALLYLPNRSTSLLRKAVDLPALSAGWQQSFRELLAAGQSDGPSAPSDAVLDPAWNGFRRFRVSRTVRETEDVLSIFLQDPAGQTLPVPKPGQYLTLRVPVAEDTVVRSYSISAVPDPATYRISVKRDERGAVSRHLHQSVAAGSEVEVAAPRGDFTLLERDNPVVLVSAGIGVTPMITMLERLVAHQTQQVVWWVQTARTDAERAFADEAAALLGRLPNARIAIYLTRADPDSGTPPYTYPGRLTPARLQQLDLPLDADAYVCGPESFIPAMTSALVVHGLSPDRIHSERFGTLPGRGPGVAKRAGSQPHAPAGPAGSGPAVTFARAGLTVPWSDRFDSLLEFAEACSVPTRWSCRSGVCHNCSTGLVSGDLRYEPQPLELPATGQVLLCCARPTTELVLDA